jgi:hypothetical protein
MTAANSLLDGDPSVPHEQRDHARDERVAIIPEIRIEQKASDYFAGSIPPWMQRCTRIQRRWIIELVAVRGTLNVPPRGEAGAAGRLRSHGGPPAGYGHLFATSV